VKKTAPPHTYTKRRKKKGHVVKKVINKTRGNQSTKKNFDLRTESEKRVRGTHGKRTKKLT